MMISTGHKTFDRQANADCITTGNVWGNVQFSNFIRAHTQTECNGFEFEQGKLQDHDLQGYRNLPKRVLAAVKSLAHNQSVILYEYRHWRGNQKHLHGYIVTDTTHKALAVFAKQRKKSVDVLKAVIPAITKGGYQDGYQLDFIS